MFLGQYYQGDDLVISHRAYTETPSDAELSFDDASPTVQIFRVNDAIELVQSAKMMAAYEHPAIEGMFRLTILLNALYNETGYYVAVISWHYESGDNPLIVRYCPFEILPTGNSNGTITAMAEVARPDKRFLLCGTSGGRLMRRANPRVQQ